MNKDIRTVRTYTRAITFDRDYSSKRKDELKTRVINEMNLLKKLMLGKEYVEYASECFELHDELDNGRQGFSVGFRASVPEEVTVDTDAILNRHKMESK